MRLTIDTDNQRITEEHGGQVRQVPLYSTEGFQLIARQFVKVSWNQKYPYTFAWLGRPVIQFPEDMIRAQEVIYRVRPDVIVETGVAHGGSLIYYASLCKVLGKGRIVGVDLEIREPNRRAIEAHELSSWITLIEGDSAHPDTVARVKACVRPGETAMVILDSCHQKSHVRAELEAYAPLVTPGSYLVATDGIMGELDDVPRGAPSWKTDNPTVAAAEFAAAHPEFELQQPPWPFNESDLHENITYWPGAWLRRK